MRVMEILKILSAILEYLFMDYKSPTGYNYMY